MANLQVNVVVQNIIEKKYPHMSERRQKEHDQYMAQQEERKKKAQFDSKESKIPVIRCDANVFKNMQARITVKSDSRAACEVRKASPFIRVNRGSLETVMRGKYITVLEWIST